VIGEMDEDQFYLAELKGKRGLVPSNLVEEMPMAGSTAANGLLVRLSLISFSYWFESAASNQTVSEFASGQIL
jgi:hypothetical protein